MGKIMGIKECAEYLGVSERTIYRWTWKEGLPSYKIVGFLKFKQNELDKWLLERKNKRG